MQTEIDPYLIPSRPGPNRPRLWPTRPPSAALTGVP